MAPSPIVTATIQAAVINLISNLLAQAITAHQANQPLTIDWIPPFQFFLFALVSTPPNFLWQDFLESTFPAYRVTPTREAVASAAKRDDPAKADAELDDEAARGRLVEPALNKRNTLAKTVLDQTAGAAANTLLFSVFMHGIQQAMAHHHAAADGGRTWRFLLGDGAGLAQAVRYADVDWRLVWERARAEFWPLITASWRFWPFVSVVNYVFLTSIEARSLMGSLAGLAWGIYISLVTGK